MFCCAQDKEPRGIIPLENLSIREVDDSKKPVRPVHWVFHWVLSLCPSDHSFGFSYICEAGKSFLTLHTILPLPLCFGIHQNCFELFIPDNKDQVIKACKTEADGRVVEGNHTFYRISAPTTEEKDEWINSIKSVTLPLL